MNHPSDDLELYALGMLDDDQRRAIDAHVRTCAACESTLGRAETTVTAMLDATLAPRAHAHATIPRARGVARAAWGAWAAAIAFAFATASLAVVDARLAAAVGDDGALFRAMLASHFVHAAFRSPAGDPVDAKVLYDRHGAWYDVIAAHARPSWRIAVRASPGAPAIARDERFAPRGDAFVLGLPALGKIDGLELRDGEGRVIGRVRTPAVGGR